MLLTFKRIFSAGLKNFKRQFNLNIATAFILSITIIVLTFIFFVDGLNKYLFSVLQQKIGITVYYNLETPTEQILAMKDELSKLKGIEGVDYTSKEEAYRKFSEKYANDPTVSKSVELVGENILPASLHIKAKTVGDYEAVMSFLVENESYQEIVNDVSYPRTEEVMKRIFNLADSIKKIGYSLSALLIFIVMLITFTAVRLAIHASREELSVMRIMGASKIFASGPYIVQGMIGGFLAAIFAFVLSLAFAFFSAASISSITGGFDLFAFFLSDIFGIVVLQLLGGMALGAAANALATKRYLEV
ncbi:MAG TPA: permease-like cell division protein FtsX [Candidatus Pacearchaeota archaeon]|nr:permease-like cell division protein FtsX [Candidatus Pacearchaeota archaeon]